MSNENFHIWEGIYERFPEETNGSAWDSDRWVDSLVEDVLPEIENIDSQCSISSNTIVRNYPLGPIIALLTKQKAEPVRVLDFGGGLASTFPSVAASLPNPELVRFEIVESKPICLRGRQVYEKFDNVIFHEHLPSDGEKFDVIHAGSSLHYVQDWQGILKRFTDFNPSLVMLSGLMAGDIKTFVTYQNYYESKCPVWFWNIGDIINALDDLGCKLIYKSLLASRYLGKEQPLPMNNFPAEYRLNRKCNLIFSPI